MRLGNRTGYKFRALRFALFFLPVILAWLACSEDPLAPTTTPGLIVASDSALVDTLAAAYRAQDVSQLSALLADRDGVEFVFVGSIFGRSMHWGAERERRIHRRMFDPTHIHPGEPPVPADHWLGGLTLSMTRIGSFVEQPDLYFDPATNPHGPDPARWRITAASYRVSLLVHVAAMDFHPVGGRVRFIVAEDLERDARQPGKFLLYRWEDSTIDSGPGNSIESFKHSWTRIKDAYAGIIGLDSAPALVDSLAQAYRDGDTTALLALFASGNAANYRFDLAVPGLDGRTRWDAATERLAHTRMFTPQQAPPPVVPSRMWIRSLALALHPLTGFVEVVDPEVTLDPGRWRLVQAEYATNVQVVTSDTTRINVNGRARFTVLEDKTLPIGASGKFTLQRWQDVLVLGSKRTLIGGSFESLSWSELKDLYLPAPPINSEATLVRFLAKAYHEADPLKMAELVAIETGTGYRFIRDQPDADTGEVFWDAREELRIHDRMLRPHLAVPALPLEHRVLHADVRFTALETFAEQSEFYASATYPEGLDPGRWRVTAALHDSEALFRRQGLSFMIVRQPVRFVVLEDLHKTPGTPRRFTLYRWDCPRAQSVAVGEMSWTQHRLLYR